MAKKNSVDINRLKSRKSPKTSFFQALKLSFYWSIGACIVFVNLCFAMSVSEQQQNKVLGESVLTETTVSRSKRAFIGRLGVLAANIGKRAVRFILEGAENIPTNRRYRLHRKTGSYQKARADFSEVVKPSDRFDYKTNDELAVAGRVGDRLLYLRRNGEAGKPTIDVVRESKTGKRRHTDRIVYKD